MSERTARREVILSLIRERALHNQSELIEALAESGISMTQSTLSRELKALGIAKGPDGRGGYCYTAGPSGEGPLSRLVAFVRTIERANNLIIVKTPPGNAQGVAHGLDEVAWPHVMGTIAGDDTILIICRSNSEGAEIEKRLRSITRR